MRILLALALFATPALADCKADFDNANGEAKLKKHTAAHSKRMKALENGMKKQVSEKLCKEMLNSLKEQSGTP